LSGQFFQRSLFAAVDAILGATVTWRRTHTKCNEPAKIFFNYYLWLSNTDCLSVSLCRLWNTTQLRSGTVDKSKRPVFLQNVSGNPICSQLWQDSVTLRT